MSLTDNTTLTLEARHYRLKIALNVCSLLQHSRLSSVAECIVNSYIYYLVWWLRTSDYQKHITISKMIS